MERQLASIQTISKIIETPVFDNLEQVCILGWYALVKKNEFKVGQKVVYIEYDSILPSDIPEFQFMEPRKFKVKTLKMRGITSQGLVFPISLLYGMTYTQTDWINNIISEETEFKDGDDVTDVLRIIKYEIPENQKIQFAKVRNFPPFIPKTDEMRLQSVPKVLDELNGQDYYVSLKEDGSSATYYVKHDYKDSDIHFGVCSRNIESIEKEVSNTYWKIAEKYDLENKLKSFAINQGLELAIQGEIGGPGMNGSGVFKNPMGYAELEFKIFNIYDITNQKYLSFYEMKNVLSILNLSDQLVQIMEISNEQHSVDEWIEIAKKVKYPFNQNPAEGIVIRPIENCWSNVLRDRLSFKVINNNFLLKEK